MSMGAAASPLMDIAVQGSINAGVVYVAAAGNANTDACTYSPARLPAAITVGASTQTDERATFSNFGSCVDLFAPGVGITSAWSWNDYATFTANGTSMAAPHVTGAVALYLEENMASTPSQTSSALLGEATSGTMNVPADGSPNLMLFTAPSGPTSAGARVSGAVVDNEGRAIKNVRVRLSNTDGTDTRMARTNMFGYYVFDDVHVGEFYVLTVQNRRYHFPNNQYSFNLSDDFTVTTFVGSPFE
jgi:subtilisin family serine protease